MVAVVVGVLVWALVVWVIVKFFQVATAGDHTDGPDEFVWDVERRKWVLSKRRERR